MWVRLPLYALQVGIASRFLLNGYSPIYFTTKHSTTLRTSARECWFFFITNKNEMIHLNTPIHKLGRGPTVRIANMALRWCKREFGINNRKKYEPVWSIVKGIDDEVCGQYDDTDNEVYIFWDQCKDVRELIQTCIHEWTHQLQPITTKYYKYPGSYSRNPYERQARYREKKYTPVFWREYKHKINNTICKKR